MDMQAVRIHSYGGPEVMQLETMPVLVPGPGQVLVKIHAASVNFIDVQQRRGALVGQAFYKRENAIEGDLPATVGSQGVGVVEALGPNVTNVEVGERIAFGGGSGTYATHALAPAMRIMPIPDTISFEQAAAGLTQGFLAYAFTHHAYPVKAGDWCLVQAAAGGLGLLITQMAKLRGGKVIGVASTEEKAMAAKAAGADETVISTKSNIAQEARRITGGKGVNVVYDGVGKDTFEANLDSLGMGGYLVIYGQASGYIPPFDLMALQDKGGLFVTRTNGLPYFKEWSHYIQDFVGWVGQGKLSITIDRTYPLAEAARAHEAFEQRLTIGRVLLVP